MSPFSIVRRKLGTLFSLLRNRALFTCTVGKCAHIISPVRLRGRIAIGDYTVIHPMAIVEARGGWIKMGQHCSINPYCVLYGHGGLTLGDSVHIAAHSVLVAANHRFDRIDIPIHRQGLSRRGITVESDVWIGANVVVTDGVRIGRGCVVSAGSVVTKDVPPFSITAGVPAVVIRSRIPPGTAKRPAT